MLAANAATARSISPVSRVSIALNQQRIMVLRSGSQQTGRFPRRRKHHAKPPRASHQAHLSEQFEPFAAQAVFKAINPVALPWGCAMLATNPAPTGSTTLANTMGTLRVNSCSAATLGLALARMSLAKVPPAPQRMGDSGHGASPSRYDANVAAVCPAEFLQSCANAVTCLASGSPAAKFIRMRGRIRCCALARAAGQRRLTESEYELRE